MLCEEKGAQLRVAPIDDDGAGGPWRSSSACSRPRTKIVAIAHVSNALGTVNPVRRMIELAHARGRRRAGGRRAGRAAPRRRRAGARTCDFYAFSAHKIYGPIGRRRALRQAGPAGGDAALAGRRRHDPLRHLREDDLQRAALQVRGGHAEHRGRDRLRGRHRLRDRDRARPHRRPRARPAGLRDASGCSRSPACASSAPRPDKAAVVSFVLDGVASRTTSAPSSTTRAWPSAPAITARSR